MNYANIVLMPANIENATESANPSHTVLGVSPIKYNGIGLGSKFHGQIQVCTKYNIVKCSVSILQVYGEIQSSLENSVLIFCQLIAISIIFQPEDSDFIQRQENEMVIRLVVLANKCTCSLKNCKMV